MVSETTKIDAFSVILNEEHAIFSSFDFVFSDNKQDVVKHNIKQLLEAFEDLEKRAYNPRDKMDADDGDCRDVYEHAEDRMWQTYFGSDSLKFDAAGLYLDYPPKFKLTVGETLPAFEVLSSLDHGMVLQASLLDEKKKVFSNFSVFPISFLFHFHFIHQNK